MVRSPDAVMGVAFTVVFPLTFVEQRVRADRHAADVPAAVRRLEPGQRARGRRPRAVRQPAAPTDVHSWPLEHAVGAGFAYCAVMLLLAVPLALRRYRARTTD